MPAWVSSETHRAVIGHLIAVRKSAGLTQRDVAKRLSKPPSFVGKIEAIERNLSITEFLAWCQALEVDPNDILDTIPTGPDTIAI